MKENKTGVSRTRRTRTDTQPVDGAHSPRRWYLLFAGSGPVPRGGLGDLVETFVSDELARMAFRDLRLKGGSAASWAQLVVVDGENGIRPLCWFGIGAAPNRNSMLCVHPDAIGSGTRTPRQRSGRLQLRRTA